MIDRLTFQDYKKTATAIDAKVERLLGQLKDALKMPPNDLQADLFCQIVQLQQSKILAQAAGNNITQDPLAALTLKGAPMSEVGAAVDGTDLDDVPSVKKSA